MIRTVIEIDEAKCNGCGVCINACQEGALGLVEGKAKLLRDDYCDGLGNCLPVCPEQAITFIEREALAYNEEEVEANIKQNTAVEEKLACGCPGTHIKIFERTDDTEVVSTAISQLKQWPVQMKLVPMTAPYFDQADLLIAADCSAYAYASFHQRFMKNRVTLIGCPKLDQMDYSEKLTELIKTNVIASVTVVRMEVPCCAGIAKAVQQALDHCGKNIPWQTFIIATDGTVLE